MNYTENFEGIKMDVQAVDISISNTLQQRIQKYRSQGCGGIFLK